MIINTLDPLNNIDQKLKENILSEVKNLYLRSVQQLNFFDRKFAEAILEKDMMDTKFTDTFLILYHIKVQCQKMLEKDFYEYLYNRFFKDFFVNF